MFDSPDKMIAPADNLSKTDHSGHLTSTPKKTNHLGKHSKRYLVIGSVFSIVVLALCIYALESSSSAVTTNTAKSAQGNQADLGSTTAQATGLSSSGSSASGSNSSTSNVTVNGKQINVPQNGTYYSFTSNSNGQSTVSISSHHTSSSSGQSSTNKSTTDINVNNSSN